MHAAAPKCPFNFRKSDTINKLRLDVLVWAFVVRKSGQGPTEETPEDRLRGIFADADAIARRKVR